MLWKKLGAGAEAGEHTTACTLFGRARHRGLHCVGHAVQTPLFSEPTRCTLFVFQSFTMCCGVRWAYLWADQLVARELHFSNEISVNFGCRQTSWSYYSACAGNDGAKRSAPLLGHAYCLVLSFSSSTLPQGSPSFSLTCPSRYCAVFAFLSFTLPSFVVQTIIDSHSLIGKNISLGRRQA